MREYALSVNSMVYNDGIRVRWVSFAPSSSKEMIPFLTFEGDDPVLDVHECVTVYDHMHKHCSSGTHLGGRGEAETLA